MCAPCKLLLNGLGIAGSMTGIEKALEALNRRGFDIPEAAYQEGVAIICGFHEELAKWEKCISEGPYVPFEQKIIPNAKKARKKA